MSMQAGRNPLDYSPWDAAKSAYFAAIQQGHEGNYEPMTYLVSKALPAQNAQGPSEQA
jgi:cell filamentation protein